VTEHRFLVLDGLRGIAAFAVLWTHAGFGFGAFYPHHGYLAVDFFFALSGFVLAHAYDERIKVGLSFTAFARRRMIRLYPMILAGAVLGALAYDPGWSGRGAELFWFDASTFLLLPFGLAFGAGSFPADIPVWSLFFELCANAAYWCVLRWWRGSMVMGLAWLAAAILLLADVAYLGQGLLRDISTSPALSFLAGFPRVAVSFTIGVLLFRCRLHEHLPRLPDFCAAILLAVLLLMPDCAWWYDLLCVLVAFPLLLALGVNARETPWLHGFWYCCGALSYPVYVIHQPVLRAVYRLHGGEFAAIILALAISWLLLRGYDEPLRRRLSQPPAAAAGSAILAVPPV
jgi:peptidoglycan/LPS O-acetylase OafA/YrhL